MDNTNHTARHMRDERRKNDPTEIIADFEQMFGRLTATERTWLRDRIADSQIFARRIPK